MKIKDIQKQIVEEFEIFDTWMDKYEYLIELGKSVPVIDEKNKTDDNIIKGCQSKVWLHAQHDNDLVKFYADSDAIITKGIVSLLIRTFSTQNPDDIINASLDFIDDIGLRQHLSPNRANGLKKIIKKKNFIQFHFKKHNKRQKKSLTQILLAKKLSKQLRQFLIQRSLLTFMSLA